MNDPLESDELEAELKTFRPRRPSPEFHARLASDMAPAPRSPASWAYPLGTALAIAACLLVAFGVWQVWTPDPAAPVVIDDPGPQEIPDDPIGPAFVQLANWRITPTGGADFEVIEPTLVRLDRGELLVESTEEERKNLAPRADGQASLRIKTPEGEVFAQGTRFYIGAHRSTERGPTETEESAMFNSLTRVLVLSGVVTLATAIGSIEGTAGDLLAAEPDKAPTKQVVQANSDFAVDLYQQLAQENEGQNLFFSPYSISGALAMTAEGARGETADQMGRVLRFPQAARRVGDDAQLIPWETSLIHTGMASLNQRLMGEKDEAETEKIRARIAELRKELDAAKQRTAQLQKNRKWKAIPAARKQEQQLARELNQQSAKVDQYEIRVANALWGEKTYPFRQEFLDTVNKHYRTGGIFPVDFIKNYEPARLRINDWVEGQTNNRIQDLIPEGVLDEYTRLVLTNAIYFKGDWAEPFKVEQTKGQDFTLADGKTVKTPLMAARAHNVARYAAFNADGSFFKSPKMVSRGKKKGLYPGKNGFAMVELPYKGDELSMVVIAPNDPQGLSTLEGNLTAAKLAFWIGQLKQRKTHVFLPKFKLETEYTLGDGGEKPSGTLVSMGMIRAFNDPRNPKTGSQFQGMTTSTNPMEQLYITKVLHKAFLEVNEKGTEAAAATAVAMAVPLSAPITTPFIPTFKADRPFVFLIRDKATGSVLFLGRMTQPAS